MKMKLPREPGQGNSGYYGGVGSKPAPTPWTPSSAEPDAAPEKVPSRFRRLRLRRTQRSKMEPTPDYVLVPAAVVIVGLLIVLAIAIFG